MILIYTFFMLAFMGFVIYLIVAYGIKYHDHNELGKDLEGTYKGYATNVSSKHLIDDIQMYFRCCGFNAATDVYFSKYLENNKDLYVNSCCIRAHTKISKLKPTNGTAKNRRLDSDLEVEIVRLKRYLQSDLDPNKTPPNLGKSYCPLSNAYKVGCKDQLIKFEPYIFYCLIATVVLCIVGALSGLLSSCDCDGDTHSIHIRTSRRRR